MTEDKSPNSVPEFERKGKTDADRPRPIAGSEKMLRPQIVTGEKKPTTPSSPPDKTKKSE